MVHHFQHPHLGEWGLEVSRVSAALLGASEPSVQADAAAALRRWLENSADAHVRWHAEELLLVRVEARKWEILPGFSVPRCLQFQKPRRVRECLVATSGCVLRVEDFFLKKVKMLQTIKSKSSKSAFIVFSPGGQPCVGLQTRFHAGSHSPRWPSRADCSRRPRKRDATHAGWLDP